MKKYIYIAVAALVLGLGISAVAQQTLETFASSIANTAVVQDQSKLPDQDNRRGYLSVFVDIADLDDVSGAVEVGPYLPEGSLVIGGYAHVVQAVLPATASLATNGSITLQSSADLLAAGTSLGSTGVKYLKPSGAPTLLSDITPQSVTITNINGASTNLYSVVTNITETTASTAYGGASILVTGATSKVAFDMGTQVAPTSGVILLVLDLIKVQ